MYDFTTLRRRRDMGAEKWAELDERQISDERVIPFSVAEMDLLAAPEFIQALREAADGGVYGYTAAHPADRQTAAAWMVSRHGWEIQPEWIVNTFGVVHAILQAIHAFTQPGDGVIIQTPAYPPFRSAPQATGRVMLENPLKALGDGRYELDFDHLEHLCARPEAKLLLLCSPHNPTGRVWTREELGKVAEICSRHGVLVFSDEIHFDFVFSPHRHTVFADVDSHCIVATSASKTFNLAGLSTAGIIIPDPQLRERFEQAGAAHAGSFNSYFGLAAAQAAYEKGGPWLDALLEHLKGNYRLAREFLAQRFPSVAVSPQEGTYLLWADFRPLGLTQEHLEAFMRRDALLFTDEGYIFGPGGEGFERLVLACPRKHLEQALERLDQAAARRGLPR